MKILAFILTLFLTLLIFLRPQDDFPKKFPNFVTQDIFGNTYTEKIFDGKLTAIFLWTDSEPCFKIFSQLDDVLLNLPKNFQIIGLIGNKNFDAKKFSSITQLQVNDDFLPILSKIKLTPTFIFVDANGFLLENPQVFLNAHSILNEMIRLSEKDSPKVKMIQSVHEIILNR